MQYLTTDDNTEMGRIVDQWLHELRQNYTSTQCQQAASLLGQWAGNAWQWCEGDEQGWVLKSFVRWVHDHDIVLNWAIPGLLRGWE
ncbi:MAG: hypothetical protein C7B47_09920 [Sulfobacillus thermosulfidooxidans]|uniref:Uncharacterized protein n=1 Tax=Sulfobacillus thermosulfidooxidans TaxID=28034 RepID=A0A2T2WX01_SULTH|nr:MAG: hypothetical protein C7B47_09920 [Sulfobacillus thermosulfidooxidans]